jgi:hypothetical protein
MPEGWPVFSGSDRDGTHGHGAWWEAFSAVLASSDEAGALRAVAERLDLEQRMALGEQQPLLKVVARIEQPELLVSIYRPEFNSPVDIHLPLPLLQTAARAATDTDISALGLLSCVLVENWRVEVGTWDPTTWRPHRIGSAAPPTGDDLNGWLEKYRGMPWDDQIDSLLARRESVVLRGGHGAGKFTCATARATVRADAGDGLIWLDLTDPNDGAESVVLELLRSPGKLRHLVVIRNIQANVSAWREILRLTTRLDTTLGIKLTILATASPSVQDIPDSIVPISVSGREVLARLIEEATVPGDIGARIARLADGNVTVGNMILDLYRSHGEIPEGNQLAERVAEKFSLDQIAGPTARQLFYKLVCYGIFGIHARESNSLDIPYEALKELQERELIFRDDGSLSVGPIALCVIFERYTRLHWDIPTGSLEPPTQLVYRYLNRVGGRQMRATLGKIDLIRVSNGSGGDDSKYLAEVWSGLTDVGNRIERRALTGMPPWTNDTAGAAFAAITLAQLARQDAWSQAAELVRSQWTYEDVTQAPSPKVTPGPGGEDFRRMLFAMQTEDREMRSAEIEPIEPADGIDVDRAYRTWVLGILLSFEGTALHRDRERIRLLQTVAENIRLDGGAFYPKRLPWVTATVIRGLYRTDAGYQDSRVVREACDWLRTPAAAGGPFKNGWESGTGTWLTNGMATACCLSALLRAEAPLNDDCVPVADRYLRAGLEQWTQPGREIDIALVLEALLRGSRRYSMVEELAVPWRNQIPLLLSWLRNNEVLGGPGSARSGPFESMNETTKVLFVAAELVATVWEIIRRELPVLLENEISAARAMLDEAHTVGGSVAAGVTEAGVYGPTPHASAANGISTDELLSLIQRIQTMIDSNIASRDKVLRDSDSTSKRTTTEVRENRNEWLAKQERCREIARRLAGQSSGEVIAELDALGREVLGSGWESIHVERLGT